MWRRRREYCSAHLSAAKLTPEELLGLLPLIPKEREREEEVLLAHEMKD